jgi:hypothetical protein
VASETIKNIDAVIGEFKDNPDAIDAGLDQLTKGAQYFKKAGAGRTAQGGSVPAPVQAVLKDAKPGTHTLSDGSVWVKSADGKITKK